MNGIEIEMMEQGGGAFGGIGGIIYIAFIILMIVSMWKIFVKAGQPGWASIIPIYNAYVLLVIAGKPGWWIVLMFVPVANLIVSILALISLAKNFGKSGGFAAGLLLLPFIFFPILGLGNAQYIAGPQQQAD